MLELKRLLSGETEHIPFAFTLDLGGITPDITSGSCAVTGECFGFSDHITFKAQLECSFTAVCARCCKEFSGTLAHGFEYPVAEKLESEEDDRFLLLEDGCLDAEAVCAEELILNLPSRFLCREDCKGLCPECGADLNAGACSCGGRRTDPRLEKLKEYFKK